ncbi:MAG: hypothetical protein J6Q54_08840, partial [Oscillospiraceae bacterium]|nr:hypothetical protein [Oscillospiraceae bacterium]
CRVNKSALALSQLNLALHLLKCVAKESVTEFDPATEEQKVIPFRAYTMEEVAPLFYAKERIFAAKAAEIDSLAVSYADLGLAEHTLLLNHSRFGLDEFGHKAYDLVVIDAEKEEKKEEDEDTDPEDTEEVAEAEPLVTPIHKEVVVVHREGERLFTKDEYTPFDYRFEIGEEKVLRKDTKPAQFIERANKVRMHHLDYLKKLKLHVFRVLSNYAGKSKENKPALLQVGTKRYTSSSTPDPRTLEEVESVAEKAYDSMFDQYMEFCAGRSVAMTDIEEQCNWFASRIDQIEQSIKKITTVAVGLLVAILLLYIPYFVLQFSAIVENMLTVVTGLCSAAVPIVLLYVIFIILATLQKRKYLKAWNDFREKSNEALNGNAIAVEKYDKLLSVIIPALRWIYEYKLDVEYCAECCDIADAKVEHHRKKLRERVNAIRNILSDLEYRDDGDKTPVKATEDAIDYTAPFCTGKQNREFYTVINDSFFGNAAN